MGGVCTGVWRKMGSHTPKGNFSSKRGNKNFYKGKGVKQYGKVTQYGNWVRTKWHDWFIPADMEDFKVCVCACVRACACVRERERERERGVPSFPRLPCPVRSCPF